MKPTLKKLETTAITFAEWEKQLKDQVFLMKTPVHKIGHCYETLAKEAGFNTYAAMRQAAKVHFGVDQC